MSRFMDLCSGVIAGASALGAGVLAAAPTDYTYPSPDLNGVAAIIMASVAALGAIGIFITQMVGLSRQKVTHDLVNSLSKETKQETKDSADKALDAAKKMAFAEGKLAGALEERAARVSTVESQRPQLPVPKE